VRGEESDRREAMEGYVMKGEQPGIVWAGGSGGNMWLLPQFSVHRPSEILKIKAFQQPAHGSRKSVYKEKELKNAHVGDQKRSGNGPGGSLVCFRGAGVPAGPCIRRPRAAAGCGAGARPRVAASACSAPGQGEQPEGGREHRVRGARQREGSLRAKLVLLTMQRIAWAWDFACAELASLDAARTR
jgi:hypothetical protein